MSNCDINSRIITNNKGTIQDLTIGCPWAVLSKERGSCNSENQQSEAKLSKISSSKGEKALRFVWVHTISAQFPPFSEKPNKNHKTRNQGEQRTIFQGSEIEPRKIKRPAKKLGREIKQKSNKIKPLKKKEIENYETGRVLRQKTMMRYKTLAEECRRLPVHRLGSRRRTELFAAGFSFHLPSLSLS